MSPAWDLRQIGSPSLPRKSGCFCGLEDEAIGFLPRNNRHLQVWSLSFLRPEAGDRRDTTKMWCISPVLFSQPRAVEESPFPAGRRMHLTPGLKHTESVGYGGGATGMPKQPPFTQQEKPEPDLPLPSPPHLPPLKGPTEGGAPARSQGTTVEYAAWKSQNFHFLMPCTSSCPWGKQGNAKPT